MRGRRARRRACRSGAGRLCEPELDQGVEAVRHAPVLDDATALDANDVEDIRMHTATGRRMAHE